MTTLNETPRGSRLHIGIFGRANVGKSSLLNAITGQSMAIVSEVAGTTTDPVYKAMELQPIGPCVFIDTAGLGDNTRLAEQREQKTKEAADRTEAAVIVITAQQTEVTLELEMAENFYRRKVPVIIAVNKIDTAAELSVIDICSNGLKAKGINADIIPVSAACKRGISEIKEALVRALPEDYGKRTLLGDLVKKGDTVLLVMPQDIQAPKGRLILPQVQTIRELLDKEAIVISATADGMPAALAALKKAPELIITDSQVFKYVYENKPKESRLTSFSVLFAAQKGDIEYYTKSAEAISALKESSRVLIAECCTHAPLSEDIGRVKIPALLRKRAGAGLAVEVVSGVDFPEDLSAYDLVIQCGGCMFNERYVASRVERAKKQGVPMTNYGIAIAYMNGILDKIEI